MPAEQAQAAKGFEHAVFGQINQVRAAHGLKGLSSSGKLSAAASRHSRRQIRAGRMSHDLGGSPLQRLSGGRDKTVGENIAFVSRRSPSRVVSMWLRSPGHRSVLLSARFRRVGIGAKRGRIAGARGYMVTAAFGG